MKGFLKFAIVVAMIAGAGYGGMRLAGSSQADAEGSKTRLEAVFRGPIEVTISSTGAVEPNLTVEVKSKAGGEIVSMPYEAGDRVKQGDLLVELDPIDEQRNVSRREAEVAIEQAQLLTARANLELSRSNYERAKSSTESEVINAAATLAEVQSRIERQRQLLREGTISQQELDKVEAELAQATSRHAVALADQADAVSLKYQVEQRRQDIALRDAGLAVANLSLDDARRRLKETRIVASMDGIITRRLVSPGQVIASAISNVGGGTALVELADLSRLFVLANIDEVDIGQVAVGQHAKLTADAWPTTAFDGIVRTIAPKGTEVSSVVVFSVKLEVQGEGLEKLKPGMTVNVGIEAGRRESALLLPIQALYYDNDSKPYVIPEAAKSTEDEKSWVYLDTGLNDGLNIEVLGGLSEGDKVQVRKELGNRTWRR